MMVAIWQWVKFVGEVWLAVGFVLYFVTALLGPTLEHRGHKDAAERVALCFHFYCLLPLAPFLLFWGLGWSLLQMPRWIAVGYRRALRFIGF